MTDPRDVVVALLRATESGDPAEAVRHMADDVVLTERTDVIGRDAFRAEFWVCGTFVVRDGKVVLWRDCYDNATFLFAWLKGLGRAALTTARHAPRQPVGR